MATIVKISNVMVLFQSFGEHIREIRGWNKEMIVKEGSRWVMYCN